MKENRWVITDETVVGGVDTHKDVHVAAVLSDTGALLGTAEFPTTLGGHKNLPGADRTRPQGLLATVLIHELPGRRVLGNWAAVW
jgi:hypothetical protein